MDAAKSRPHTHSISCSVVVLASPEAVWDVLTDPSYGPKLYPDVVHMEARPAGPAVIAQKRTALARAGRRRLEIFAEVSKLVHLKEYSLRQLPGGLFTIYEEDYIVTSNGSGTEVRARFRYELSKSYLGEALNMVMLEESIARSLRALLLNLKEIAELRPLPNG